MTTCVRPYVCCMAC